MLVVEQMFGYYCVISGLLNHIALTFPVCFPYHFRSSLFLFSSSHCFNALNGLRGNKVLSVFDDIMVFIMVK